MDEIGLFADRGPSSYDTGLINNLDAAGDWRVYRRNY